MKTTVLTVILWAAFLSAAAAQTADDCVSQCLSQTSDSNRNETYCREKCDRVQEPYGRMQVDMQQQSSQLQQQMVSLLQQSLDVQRQQLEVFKESLDLQRQQFESQKQMERTIMPSVPGQP